LLVLIIFKMQSQKNLFNKTLSPWSFPHLSLTQSKLWWRHLGRSQMAISTLRQIRLLIPVYRSMLGHNKNVSLGFIYLRPILFGQLDLPHAHPSDSSYFASLVWISISATRRRSTWALKGQSRVKGGFRHMRERLLSWHRLFFFWRRAPMVPKKVLIGFRKRSKINNPSIINFLLMSLVFQHKEKEKHNFRP